MVLGPIPSSGMEGTTRQSPYGDQIDVGELVAAARRDGAAAAVVAEAGKVGRRRDRESKVRRHSCRKVELEGGPVHGAMEEPVGRPAGEAAVGASPPCTRKSYLRE